ncbi:pol protein [Cucumis melo var. makuwa]|uniref:Pol protein n=1 Tax=Cucumis melo var. makuwa TaxID=1194695 RepID=A0A5D3DDY7_CUCMM|nr:pol protein [Cucumis melo var. makuwa]
MHVEMIVLVQERSSDANVCPSCGLSRWKIPKNLKKEVKNVPMEIMWYFSPIPRFERMFRSKETSRLLTWHGRKREVNDLLQHPKDALSWKKIDNLWLEFGSEPRNLPLALSTDGDYDCEILYHPGKANVVADALSRKVSHSAALITRQAPLHRDLERAEIAVSVGTVTMQLAQLTVQPTLRSLYVPLDSAVKTKLLSEAHSSPFSMHPGSTKMYQDLKRVYWWRNMKREVAEFVSKCLVHYKKFGL